jgi:hypothetical protein
MTDDELRQHNIDPAEWHQAVREAVYEAMSRGTVGSHADMLREIITRLARKLGREVDTEAIDDLERYMNEPVEFQPEFQPECQAIFIDMTCEEIARDEQTLHDWPDEIDD